VPSNLPMTGTIFNPATTGSLLHRTEAWRPRSDRAPHWAAGMCRKLKAAGGNCLINEIERRARPSVGRLMVLIFQAPHPPQDEREIT
jgi:hypothetical protein